MLPALHAGPAPWTWVYGAQTPNFSSDLALQAVGVRIRRSRSVALDGTLGVAMTLYALLVSNFLDTVASLLQVMMARLRKITIRAIPMGKSQHEDRSRFQTERLRLGAISMDLRGWVIPVRDSLANRTELCSGCLGSA
jgi:hypothetical protein